VQQQQQKWIFQPIITAVTSVLVPVIYVANQTYCNWNVQQLQRQSKQILYCSRFRTIVT